MIEKNLSHSRIASLPSAGAYVASRALKSRAAEIPAAATAFHDSAIQQLVPSQLSAEHEEAS